MKMKMYSLLDEKAKVFSRPFYANTDGEALRSFSSVIEDKNSMPGKFPIDFTLWKVGEFDDNTGHISMLEAGVSFLAKGVDFVKVVESK